MSNYEDYALNNFSDAFYKQTESVLYKLLCVIFSPIYNVEETVQKVIDSNSLDLASGKVLDTYGVMLNQPRGKANDSLYRVMLKSKIARDNCDGTTNGIIRAICTTFDCNPSDISIKANEANPLVMSVTKFPLALLLKFGLTTRQTKSIIQRILPITISLDLTLFEGTFQYADKTQYESDPEKGFADNSQATGGYYGALYGYDDETSENLPL